MIARGIPNLWNFSPYTPSKIMGIERKVGKVEVISKPIFVYFSGCDGNGNIYKIFKSANKDTIYFGLDNEVIDLTNKVGFVNSY